jgi:hypothetical protein
LTSEKWFERISEDFSDGSRFSIDPPGSEAEESRELGRDV